MKLWEPTHCCCFDRKTGSLILGSLVLIGSILSIIGVVLALACADVPDIIYQACTPHDPELKTSPTKESDYCVNIVTQVVIGVISFFMILAVLQMTFSSMLIHGVRKQIPCLMTPFMVMRLLSISFSLLAIVIVIGLLLYLGAIGAVFIFIIVKGPLIFLETYYLLVIRAHYREIKQATGEMHEMLVEAPDNDLAVRVISQTSTVYK